jgi:hypothetical protein
MKTEYKIYATVALAAIIAVGVLAPHGDARKAVEEPAAAQSTTLQRVGLPAGAAATITKIQLTNPHRFDEESSSPTIVLEKQDAGWELTSPVKTRASASKVAALLDNLKGLTLRAEVDRGTAPYELYGVADGQGVHVVASSDEAAVSDLRFGRSDARGQMVRVAGVYGVFSMANSGPHGYSGFLYTRGLRSWRETAILTFAEGDVDDVEVTNGNGRFSFSKNGGTWSGSMAKRNRDGTLRAAEGAGARFDASKVDDLLRVYRSLSADDFGDARQRADSGVDDAERTGGVVRIRLKESTGERTILVGKLATNAGRWAIKNSRWAIEEGGDGTLYALAPWSADWAVADERKFERAAP